MQPTATHRLLYRLAGLALFNRTLVRGAVAPSTGPVLFVGLHRNGAIDGIPYLRAAPRAVYILSMQLHRSALLRCVFPGITVARGKDRERGMQRDNSAALQAGIDHLLAGGQLFVLPEGTSTLGPRRLALKPGAAHIAAGVLAAGSSLTLVPLALHYERAWAWQSRVEVLVGPAVRLEPGMRAPEELMPLITRCLDGVGVNVDSEEEQRVLETLAFCATLGAPRSYAHNLKRLEAAIPQDLRARLARVLLAANWAGAWCFQGLPLVPAGRGAREAFELLLLAPLLATALIANAPALILGALACRRLPDDRNVVAFWRALVGIPAAVLWAAAVVVALALEGLPAFALAYLVVSTCGIRALRVLKIRSVAVHNLLFAPQVIAPMRELTASLTEHLSHA
jgi:hypothetical protein